MLSASAHLLLAAAPPCIYLPLSSSPSISSLAGDVGGKTLAVEIKVIKDLPWPPPVGQLNTGPPLVEELESPSQTAQPQPGQTSCDQHHHGGCWCSHCNSVIHTLLTRRLSVHPYPQKLLSVVSHRLYEVTFRYGVV